MIPRWYRGLTKRRRRGDNPAAEPSDAAAAGPREAGSADAGYREETAGEAGHFRTLDRRAFERVVADSLKGGRTGGCLLLCDVDRCREINAVYGREAGDAVIGYAGDVIRDIFGEYVCAGSFGGGRYALWLPTVSAGRAGEIGRGIGIVNDRLLHPSGEMPPASVSAGAAFGRAGDDVKSIHDRARQALRQVKDNGNCGFEAAL